MITKFLQKTTKQTQNYCIRFSYHKCLTHYMGAIFDKNKHFMSKQKDFVAHLEEGKKEKFISINNTAMWSGRKIFANAKMIHLIRHPKDIVISGYFYHKKGSETWNREPMHRPWIAKFSFELDHILNDEEKKLLHPDYSYQDLLSALPFEKGVMTEMIWLKYVKTFNPIVYYEAPNVKTYRFEEIVAQPVEKIGEICTHWLLSEEEIEYYSQRADYYDRNPNYPIRNRSANQYREYYNQDLNAFFKQQFHHIVKRLDYPD